MAVVIGSLSSGTAPCVEAPESPDIEIGQPTTLASSSVDDRGRTVVAKPELDGVEYSDYADLASVREIVVKRKFYCLKSDIQATLNWLASLSGGTVDYNAGKDGTKKIAGQFQLKGRVAFGSFSPSIAVASAEFIGASLDVNFLMPSCLTFVRVSSKVWQIKVDNTVVKQYETATDGNGAGIAIAAGAIKYWDELAAELRDTLPKSMTELPIDADDVVPTAKIWMLQYREIHLTVNGEIARTWYVPCLGTFERKRIVPKRTLMGITETEYVDQSYAVAAPFNPRIHEDRYSRQFTYTAGASGPLEYVPGQRTGQPIHFASAHLGNIIGGPYLPPIEQVVVSSVPRTYTRYVFAGWEYVSTLQAVEGMSPSDALVKLWWDQTDDRVRLLAKGCDKTDMTLMEWER